MFMTSPGQTKLRHRVGGLWFTFWGSKESREKGNTNRKRTRGEQWLSPHHRLPELEFWQEAFSYRPACWCLPAVLQWQHYQEGGLCGFLSHCPLHFLIREDVCFQVSSKAEGLGKASQASLHNTSGVWLVTSAGMWTKEGLWILWFSSHILSHYWDTGCEALLEGMVDREGVCNFTHFV